MLAWNQESSCLLVNIEDLLGEPGGSTREKQKAVIEEIAAYLGESSDEKMAERLTEIDIPTASVFKKGAWQNLIDKETSDRLVECCENLCQEAGHQGAGK
jgi:crotonobetainyl-CoA:carnitine CoA-transferase CaiB-like acyl-CoA transferase